MNRLHEPYYELHVVDLTSDRVFRIEPDMEIVRDAFWWDGSLLLLGCYQGEESLYQYDIKTGTIKKFLGGATKGGLWNSRNWSRDFENCYSICRIDRVDDRFYFLFQHIAYMSTPVFEFYSAWVDEKGTVQGDIIYRPDLRNEFLVFGDNCFYWGDDCCLKKYDFTIQKATKIDDGGPLVRYLLLGDYLYKKEVGQAYKTNISQGTDHLQWEVM